MVYRHGGSSWAEGVTVDFSDNSNPIGPPRRLLELVREAVERGVHLRFPANLAEEALGQYEGMPVTAFNGATEALLALLAHLRPRRLVVPWPNYSDYLRLAEALGVPAVRGDPTAAGPGDVVVMSNPNNPTGRLVPRDAVLDLARRLTARGVRLVVDESFMDFAGGETAAPDVPAVKSYGKLLAAPGLRVGAVLGRVPEALRAPWRLNSMADYAIYHLGADGLRAHRQATRLYVAEETPRVASAISRCREVWPTDVHFFVVWGPLPPLKVRPLDDLGLAGRFRVSIKGRRENDMLVEALCATGPGG